MISIFKALRFQCLAASFAIVSASGSANSNLLPELGAPAWELWSSNPLFAPEGGVERISFSMGTNKPSADGREVPALVLRSRDVGGYVRWSAPAAVAAGTWYEFSVWQRTEGVDFENIRTPLFISWFGSADGSGLPLRRDAVEMSEAGDGGWTRRWIRVQAPEQAHSMRVELSLRWVHAGAAWWHSPRLTETAPPPARKVRIATTRILPTFPSTEEKNLQLIDEMFDRVAAEGADLILFSEVLNDRGVPKPLAERAQTIPGPFTGRLSKKAREHHMWAAAALYEKDAAGRFYITLVLINREGQIAKTYRKIHLPMTEAEAGVVPGNDYVVADTDFGRVGLLICWDNWFPEPMRIMSLLGAEIVLLPIAGDSWVGHWDAVSRARAMDNGIYLVSSATVTDISSCIINPAGDVMAKASGPFDYALCELDLNRVWTQNRQTLQLAYTTNLNEPKPNPAWAPGAVSVGRSPGDTAAAHREDRRPDTYAPLVANPSEVRNAARATAGDGGKTTFQNKPQTTRP